MSAIASAATATVLAFGVAMALDAQPGVDRKVAQVQQHGAPGPAQVELAEKTAPPAPAERMAETARLDGCHDAAADQQLHTISPATRSLSAWPEISGVLRPAAQPDPPRAADLVKLSVGPTSGCAR